MLIITDYNKERREALSELYHFMGVLTSAENPDNLYFSIDNGTSAILFASTDGVDKDGLLLGSLRQYTNLPIFAITDTVIPGFDLTFSPRESYPDILESIKRYCDSNGIHTVGSYEAAGISASAFDATASFLGEPISLTRSEMMILRYVIAIHPRPATAQSILRYAFRPSRSPEVSGVRTHLSVMNKKFREKFGRCLISANEEGGYSLSVLSPSPARSASEPVTL